MIHPASYPMGIGGKAAGKVKLITHSIYCRGKNGGAVSPLTHVFSWRDA
jgi:hypothetical protein